MRARVRRRGAGACSPSDPPRVCAAPVEHTQAGSTATARSAATATTQSRTTAAIATAAATSVPLRGRDGGDRHGRRSASSGAASCSGAQRRGVSTVYRLPRTHRGSTHPEVPTFFWPGTVRDGGQLSEGCGRWGQSQDVTKARGAALQRLHCAELLLFLRSETACAGPSQQEVEKEEVVVVRSHRARGPAWNARCRMSTWPRRGGCGTPADASSDILFKFAILDATTGVYTAHSLSVPPAKCGMCVAWRRRGG